MFDVAAFLARAKAGAGDVSDYRLAQLLGVTKQAISKIRSGAIPSDGVALRLCDYSGDEKEHVLACLQSMRAANDDEAEVWQRIADYLRRRTAAVATALIGALAAAGAGLTPSPAQATTLSDGGSAYYVKRLLRLICRRRPHSRPAGA